MRRKKHKQRPSRVEFEHRCTHMVQDVLNKIRSNEYPEGSFLPSEADLCKEYSLSRSSVRKVLEQLEKMVTLTRQQGKGIVVGNPEATKMTFGEEKRVMILLPFGYQYEAINFSPESPIDVGNAVYALERELAAHEISCSFLFYNSDEDFNVEDALNRVLAEKVSVFVTVRNYCDKMLDLAKHLGFHGIKIVSVFDDMEFSNCSNIHVNNFSIGELAAKHLIEQGHMNIACIASEYDYEWEVGRIKGFLETCEGAGLAHCSELVFKIPVPNRLCDFNDEFMYVGENGAKLIHDQVVMENPEITGIFCINDKVAKGVFKYAREKHVGIPDDWSVVGCDNAVDCLDMNLTTISQEIFQCGHMAAEIIVDYFSGRMSYAWPIDCKVHPVLLRRGSTKELS